MSRSPPCNKLWVLLDRKEASPTEHFIRTSSSQAVKGWHLYPKWQQPLTWQQMTIPGVFEWLKEKNRRSSPRHGRGWRGVALSLRGRCITTIHCLCRSKSLFSPLENNSNIPGTLVYCKCLLYCEVQFSSPTIRPWSSFEVHNISRLPMYGPKVYTFLDFQANDPLCLVIKNRVLNAGTRVRVEL